MENAVFSRYDHYWDVIFHFALPYFLLFLCSKYCIKQSTEGNVWEYKSSLFEACRAEAC